MGTRKTPLADDPSPLAANHRREALKLMGATVAGMATGGVAAAAATAAPASASATAGSAKAAESPAGPAWPRNPYGGGPGAGLTLPPYYRPTASLKNNHTYFPGSEELGKDEMRISFVGSIPFPAMRSQAGTCIMVELGNGKRYFFDFGSGCLKNLIAMQIPVQMVNDIFLTHLTP